MKKIASRSLLLLVALLSLVSGCECSRHTPDTPDKYDQVLILYSAGFNSLCNYLREDIQDLKSGYVPGQRDSKAFLVVSHLAASRGNYSTKTSPQLIRIYKNKKGIVFDTLKTYTGNILVRKEDMTDILSDIRTQFKSDHYGMVYSSHATGWLPPGYYDNPEYYERGGRAGSASAARPLPDGAVPYREPEEIPGAPEVKSLGQSRESDSVAYETDIVDFIDAIPMHLDYLLLDACLAGGIETAYQFKDKVDLIGFSQAEILADGFDYPKLAGRLLEGSTPNVEAVVDDYYQQYTLPSSDKSATISLVDCRRLDGLTSLCRDLFGKYRESIAGLDPGKVQRFYRTGHHWFYDLEDILVKAGITADERKALTDALSSCILYKAATEYFLYNYGGFKIETFSGLSMYLPCNGSAFLDSYYKDLAWNKATLLVD